MKASYPQIGRWLLLTMVVFPSLTLFAQRPAGKQEAQEPTNSFAGIPFGSSLTDSVKALKAATKTELAANISSNDKQWFEGGVFDGHPATRFALEFNEGLLRRGVVFVKSTSKDNREEFTILKKMLLSRYGMPESDSSIGKNLHAEWTLGVVGSDESCIIGLDNDAGGSSGCKISYRGPALGKTAQLIVKHPIDSSAGTEVKKPQSPATASALNKPSRFISTKWERDDSTIDFYNTGSWHETWLKKQWNGTWKAKSESEVIVTRSDGHVFHYIISDDGQTVSRDDGTKYERSKQSK